MRARSLFRPWLLPTLLFGVGLGVLISVGLIHAVPKLRPPAVADRAVSPRSDLDADERSTIALFHKASKPSADSPLNPDGTLPPPESFIAKFKRMDAESKAADVRDGLPPGTTNSRELAQMRTDRKAAKQAK